MMKKSEQDLIGRAVTDADFRRRLLADPDGTIASEDYAISDEMRQQIKDAAASSPDAIDAAIHAAGREGGIGG